MKFGADMKLFDFDLRSHVLRRDGDSASSSDYGLFHFIDFAEVNLYKILNLVPILRLIPFNSTTLLLCMNQ